MKDFIMWRNVPEVVKFTLTVVIITIDVFLLMFIIR
jgi:hypothetical protein